MVVEVLWALNARKLLSQNVEDHSPRRRFANAAGNGDDVGRLPTAMPAGEVFKCCLCVLDANGRKKLFAALFGIHDANDGSALNGFLEKVVSVVLFATEGPKDFAGLNMARVDADSVEDLRNVCVSRRRSANDVGELF